jgi:hypothetical protein
MSDEKTIRKAVTSSDIDIKNPGRLARISTFGEK